jgi:hypothetical protein
MIVEKFGLSIDGLTLAYSANNVKNIFQFDALSTCNLFQDLNIIEGFDTDKNGEPVILFTQSFGRTPTTGFCFWCDFIRSHPFCKRQAEIIGEQIESAKAKRKLIKRINSLLKPKELKRPVFA